jgi:hypothetical protein
MNLDGNPNWTPGVSGNPNGRPKGSRNRRTQEILDAIRERGDKDPVDALSEIVTTTTNQELKVQAANILAPYLHSKRSTAPTPRYIDEPVVVPQFTCIEEAENYLAEIPRRVGQGKLDFQSGLDLSTLTKNWIDAKYAREELQLKLAVHNGIGGEQRITVHGGLPTLPGCENLIMPVLNGNEINGEVIHALDAPETESIPPQQEPSNGNQGS